MLLLVGHEEVSAHIEKPRNCNWLLRAGISLSLTAVRNRSPHVHHPRKLRSFSVHYLEGETFCSTASRKVLDWANILWKQRSWKKKHILVLDLWPLLYKHLLFLSKNLSVAICCITIQLSITYMGFPPLSILK